MTSTHSRLVNKSLSSIKACKERIYWGWRLILESASEAVALNNFTSAIERNAISRAARDANGRWAIKRRQHNLASLWCVTRRARQQLNQPELNCPFTLAWCACTARRAHTQVGERHRLHLHPVTSAGLIVCARSRLRPRADLHHFKYTKYK